MQKRCLIGAVMAAAVFVPAAQAHATTWKACGSVSRLVNEGNNRATAIVSMKRDPNTTIICATARSVARKALQGGPGDSLIIAGRLWYMDRGATQRTTFTYTRGPHAVVRVRISTSKA